MPKGEEILIAVMVLLILTAFGIIVWWVYTGWTY